MDGPVRIYTIPHTGTNFVRALLEWRMGVELEGVHHTEMTNEALPWIERGGKTVVAVRDPVMAAISSLNRDERPKLKPWKRFAAWRGA